MMRNRSRTREGDTPEAKGKSAMRMSVSLAIALTALMASGCSVVVGGSVNDVCDADADCETLGYSNATCDTEKKVCVPGGGGGACETTQECEDKNSGQPAICRADTKTCAPLLSVDCAEVAGDYKDPNAIVLGFLGPLTGSDASTGLPIADGTKLALDELSKNTVGLPGGPDGAVRPLAMVYCHDLDGPEDDPWRAAKHLVNNVGVQAIVGPAFSGVTINTAKTVTIPKGVLTISGSATSPSITDLDDNDLVWRTCPSDALQAIPLAGLLSPLEAQIRAEQAIPEGTPIRVAMTVKGDAYGTGLADAVVPLLAFNGGKSTTENGENFLRQDYKDPTENTVDYSPIISKLTNDFQPHVVLVLGTTEGVQEIFTQVEAQWPNTNPETPRPYYLFPDGGKVSELQAAIGNSDSVRRRVRGTVPGGSSSLYDAFRSRYKAFFDQKEPLAFADTGYDATYLLAYAMVAAGDKELTGVNISAGMKRMNKGTPIDATPGKINAAFQALQSGGEIDYSGASGPLNFDNTTGEAKANIDIWCVAFDGSMKPVFKSTGQKYDAVQGKVVGTYSCD